MPHSGHLLPVKGMLAREHTELILALEVFQTDCTGLLRGEGGGVERRLEKNHTHPSAHPHPGKPGCGRFLISH